MQQIIDAVEDKSIKIKAPRQIQFDQSIKIYWGILNEVICEFSES